LLARIDRHLPERGQLLPNKGERTQYLDRQQEQIGLPDLDARRWSSPGK
jgi:hypothetical protein